MQPEPSAISEISESSTAHEAYTSTQHGLHDIAETISTPPADSVGAGTAVPIYTERVSATLYEARDVLAQSSGRLSPRSTPSPPSGRNRVSEYEQASTPPIRKRAGPSFEVIKKYRSPTDNSSPIQELPNGKSTDVC